jgi:hypothetical protein
MPRLSGDHELEAAPGGVPALELRNLDGHATGARETRHSLVDLHAEHLATACGEQPGGDSGAAADVEHSSRRIGVGRLVAGEQRIDHRRRI